MAGLEYENEKWMPNWAWEKNDEFLTWLSSSGVVFPTPTYKVGQKVSFNWNNAVARNGRIDKVWIAFDHKWEREWRNLTEENITYDVYWNGHSRWVKLRDIIKD